MALDINMDAEVNLKRVPVKITQIGAVSTSAVSASGCEAIYVATARIGDEIIQVNISNMDTIVRGWPRLEIGTTVWVDISSGRKDAQGRYLASIPSSAPSGHHLKL